MEWVTVTKNSNSRIRSHQTGTISSSISLSYTSYHQKIHACKKEFSQNGWAKNLSDRISGKIIAVGLGNFSSSDYSISQHALYEYLIEENKVNGELFDPAYSSEETTYLEEKGYRVNIKNFNKEQQENCTFLMIHCHYSLYENLLLSEWIQNFRICIIGNSLNDIKTKFLDQEAFKNAESFQSIDLNLNDLAFYQTYLNTNY